MRGVDAHLNFLADCGERAGQVNGLQIGRPATDLAGVAAGASDEHRQGQAGAGGVEGGLLIAQHGLQLLQATVLFGFRDLHGGAGGGGAGAGGVFEAEGG